MSTSTHTALFGSRYISFRLLGLTLLVFAIQFAMVGCNNPNKDLASAEMMSANPNTTNADGQAGELPLPPPIVMPYVLEDGDEVIINVLQDERLNGTYRLDSDGGFQWHYAGRVRARGLTTNDIRRKLAGVLEEYIVDPSVTVNLTAQRGRYVNVLGFVKSAGRIAVRRDMRIVDALTEAGGLVEDGRMDCVILVRRMPDNEIRAGIFNYKEATLNPIESGAWASNVILQPGDTIIVPKSKLAQWNTAVDTVRRFLDTAVNAERGIVLYPDAREVLKTGDSGGKNTIVVK